MRVRPAGRTEWSEGETAPFRERLLSGHIANGRFFPGHPPRRGVRDTEVRVRSTSRGGRPPAVQVDWLRSRVQVGLTGQAAYWRSPGSETVKSALPFPCPPCSYTVGMAEKVSGSEGPPGIDQSWVTLDALQEAYIRLDSQLRFAFVNAAAERLLGEVKPASPAKRPGKCGRRLPGRRWNGICARRKPRLPSFRSRTTTNRGRAGTPSRPCPTAAEG